jgi:hypothetical protein
MVTITYESKHIFFQSFSWRRKFEYCEICLVYRHDPCHCLMLQKYWNQLATPKCKLCKSYGHNVENYTSVQSLHDYSKKYSYFFIGSSYLGTHRGRERGRGSDDDKGHSLAMIVKIFNK